MSMHLFTRKVDQGSKEQVFDGDSLINLRTSILETTEKNTLCCEFS